MCIAVNFVRKIIKIPCYGDLSEHHHDRSPVHSNVVYRPPHLGVLVPKSGLKISPTAFKTVTHCIFDMDGTVLDTEIMYIKCIRKLCENHGRKYPYHLQSRLTGATDKTVAETVVKELNMPMSAAEFEAQLVDLARRTLLGAPLKKGVERLLTHLYDNKIPMALATNSTEQAVRLQSTARPKLFGMFHHKVSITDPEVFRGKPYPDIYLVAASRFPDKPKPNKCLVFEDSPRGVQAAREAGMQVVMTPEVRLEREKTRQATLVLPSLMEFKPELFGLPPFVDPPPKPLTKRPRPSTILGDEALGDKNKKDDSKKPGGTGSVGTVPGGTGPALKPGS